MQSLNFFDPATCCEILSKRKKTHYKKKLISDIELINFKEYIILAINKNKVSRYLPLFDIKSNNASLFKKYLREVFYCSLREFLYINTVELALQLHEIFKFKSNTINLLIEHVLSIDHICNKCNERLIRIIFFNFIKNIGRMMSPNENYNFIYNCEFNLFQPINEFNSIFFRRLISDQSFVKNEITFNKLSILFKNHILNIKKQSKIQEEKLKLSDYKKVLLRY